MSDRANDQSDTEDDPTNGGNGGCEIRTGALILGLVCGNALIYVLYEGTPSETLVFWIIWTVTATFVGCGCCHQGVALRREARQAQRFTREAERAVNLAWERRGWLVMLRTRQGEPGEAQEWVMDIKPSRSESRLGIVWMNRHAPLRHLVDTVVQMEEGVFREIVRCL